MNDSTALTPLHDVRRLPLHADVLVRGRVLGTRAYAGPGGSRLWAALLADETDQMPAFGFDSEPPGGGIVRVQALVTGFVASAFENEQWVARMIAQRGWVDPVELLVDRWDAE